MIAFGIIMIFFACGMAIGVAQIFYEGLDGFDIAMGIFVGLIDAAMFIGGIIILVDGVKLANVQL